MRSDHYKMVYLLPSRQSMCSSSPSALSRPWPSLPDSIGFPCFVLPFSCTVFPQSWRVLFFRLLFLIVGCCTFKDLPVSPYLIESLPKYWQRSSLPSSKAISLASLTSSLLPPPSESYLHAFFSTAPMWPCSPRLCPQHTAVLIPHSRVYPGVEGPPRCFHIWPQSLQ